MSKNYSVAITTFNSRFELFKNLFRKIKIQRPRIEILVLINGLTSQKFDENYRKSILEFIAPYENTFPYVFPEFISNSKMWNLSCQFMTSDKVLMIQDDLDIEDTFFDDFESVLSPEHKFFVLNDSYSSFVIDKYTLDELNWFDERYLGIGHEDGTWTMTYGNRPSLTIPSMCNSVDVNFKDWQWELLQNEKRLEGQRLCIHSQRYSEFNNEINDAIRAKQPVYGVPEQKQYPYQKFYWDNKDKL